MSDMIVLEAQPRERAGKGAARAERREGLVPGVIYGANKDPQMLTLDPKALMAELRKPAFFATQYSVKVGGAEQHVLPRDVQFHPITDQPMHVDFMRVTDRTRVTVAIPVLFEGEEESPGIKRGGVLNVVRHEIEVVTAVGNMPERFVFDLSELDIGDAAKISMIDLPDGVTPTITDRDFTVATIAAPTVVRDEAAEEQAAEEEEGEEFEGELPEGEEGEEGAAEEGEAPAEEEAKSED